MENEVLRDVLLVLSVLAVFVFGFFIMKRLDAYLDKNCKPYIKQEDKPERFVYDDKTSDEQILSDIKKLREKGAKIKIVVSDETNDDDEQ